MTELKPCPFCGGKANLAQTVRTGFWYIICRNCDIATLQYSSAEKARRVWNRRANDDSID